MQSHFSTPITKEEMDLCGFAFVDDSDIIAASENYSPKDTMEKCKKWLTAGKG